MTTNNTPNNNTRPVVIVADGFRPTFNDAPMFGIDLSGATVDRRADTHRETLRPFGR